MKKKEQILILPSWYSTPDAPHSGTFFREQSVLAAEDFDVQVWSDEKEWVSKRRFLWNRFFSNFIRTKAVPHEIQPPSGWRVKYQFCKFLSDEENLDSRVDAYTGFLRREKKRFSPRLIHAHCTMMAGILAYEISKRTGIPYLITEHFSPFDLKNYSPFWQEKMRLALENANRVLAVSEFEKKQIELADIHCSIDVVGNLVRDDLFYPAPGSGLTGRPVKLLCVAYFPNRLKSVDTFFDALVILKSRDIKFEATIIGGGEIQGELGENPYSSMIGERELDQNCRIIGSADRASMVSYMQECDIYICSSWVESFGISPAEAMLCGKPVVSTDCGGVRDFLSGENSICVPVRDPRALADGIARCIENYRDFEPASIRQTIVSRFGKDSFGRRLKSIYRSVL